MMQEVMSPDRDGTLADHDWSGLNRRKGKLLHAFIGRTNTRAGCDLWLILTLPIRPFLEQILEDVRDLEVIYCLSASACRDRT